MCAGREGRSEVCVGRVGGSEGCVCVTATLHWEAMVTH